MKKMFLYLIQYENYVHTVLIEADGQAYGAYITYIDRKRYYALTEVYIEAISEHLR